VIHYDSVIVHYLARELDTWLRARRLRGVRFDSEARRFVLETDRERIVWELHPARGWIRLVPESASPVRIAAEGWEGRRIPTQRRPRVRGVTAPPDERWLEIEIDAGGPDRASRFVVELLSNQWNVLALGPDRTILAALRRRESGHRSLRPGLLYTPPAGRRDREGVAGPIPLDRWLELLADEPPSDRERVLVRHVAWMSPLNTGPVLGPAALDHGGDDVARLEESWQRYEELASLPPPAPQILELRRPTPYPVPLPGASGKPMVSLLAAFDTVAADVAGTPALAPEVREALRQRLDQVRRRGDRLREEAEEAPARAAELRRRADLLMAQLHRVHKGEVRVVLDDFEGGTVTLDLDPALGPADNARALYDRARKRDRAAARLPDRVRQAVAERNRLEALLEAIDAGVAEPEELARRVAEVRPLERTGGRVDSRLPYHRFRSSGGLEIRVGRSGRANDDLTFRHASPDDVWLHARDAAGAHVILRWSERDRNPPQRDLVEAAILAAVHSRARTSGTVPVDWTRRKHVRKPRKAPPGAVLPDRLATLFVRPDPELPDRLRPTDEG
jgi:hypothetical protein